MNKVIILYGPPGAGKGTQANLFADVFGLIHFDTGKYLEQIVRDPANAHDPIIQKEKANFDSGILLTPSWVLEIVREKATHLAKVGFGVVLSGSPRTLFEAFGDANNEGLVPIFEREFGKENMFTIVLDVKPETSIVRNSRRLVCATCGTAILAGSYSGQICPLCGSPLRRRSLDVPDVIRVRLQEYEKRTEPILLGMKDRGHQITHVNGEPEPYKVFDEITTRINLKKH